MSEQEHERPLTRRELRLREQAASESAQSVEDLAGADDAAGTEAAVLAAQAEAEAAQVEDVDIEVEIDPLNPDGTPRTRREVRELREAAIAAILAEREAAQAAQAAASEDPEEPAEPAAEAAEQPAEDEEEAPAEDDFDAYGPPTEALSVEDLPGTDAGSETAGSESAAAPDVEVPTEEFTLEDILDAAEPSEPVGDADAVANLFADADHEAEAAGAEADAEDSSSASSGKATEVAPEAVGGEEDAAADTDSEAAAGADGNTTDAHGTDALDDEDAPDDSADDEEDDDTSKDTAGYSFPDIQPPEEWRSVFDDPTRAANIATPADQGDFDDLISRAVAQEGSTGGTGASALILPSHPGGDTGGLSGPLGATGELFVTGSIELPRSLGETGGHSALHDSIDFDPFLTGETGETIAPVDESGPMPVSALSAVSAQRRPEVPVVAEPTKDRSKMPLILALSGGGLIVVVIGGVIYAATQGFFG